MEHELKSLSSIDKEWNVKRQLIDGVKTKNIKNVINNNSLLTEAYRAEWEISKNPIRHIMHTSFHQGAICAWHMHKKQTDHFICINGVLKIILYDDRQGSRTRGLVNVFHIGHALPILCVVPPEIWHGFQNLHSAASSIINFTDKEFCYEDPDHYRLPWNTDKIPHNFQ